MPRMAKPFLIIDGYNLMHAAGMSCRRYGPGEFEKRRNRFLRFLAKHLGESERRRTTVVFDAQNAEPGGTRGSQFEEMEILFASGRAADDLIEEIIAAHSAPKQILLVSSDHRLQKAARRRRANSVDSEEFVAELERHGPIGEEAPSGSIANNPKFTGQTSATETASWMREFGEIPDADVSRSDISDHDFWGIDVEKLEEEME